MSNELNEVYVAPIWIGSPLQGESNGRFVFDTTSGMLAVASTGCTNCVYTYFNSTASSSYSASADTTVTTNIVQGIANIPMTLTGSLGNDKVCISNDDDESCVSDFDFFLITSQEGLNELDGVLGLAPPTAANGPSFMYALD